MKFMDEQMAECVKAGELLRMESGQFSDYGVDGLFRVQHDLYPYVELARYITERPEQGEDYHFRPVEFMEWLVEQGWLELEKHQVLHTTDYGLLEYLGLEKHD